MPDTRTDLRVERIRIDSPTLATAYRQAALGLGFPISGVEQNPESIYGAEQKFLETLAVVPLVYAPELMGLGSHVKDWSALPWGAWRLENLWLEAAKP
jgi:hypothetical protein